MATNQEELLDTIGNMTVLELSEFVDAFKDKFNVTAAAAPVAMPEGGGAEAESKMSSMSFSRALAKRRSRSSRLCASSPAWASRRRRSS